MMPTPEARERVERIVTGAFDLGHSITVEDLRGIIATELTAVRAALVAEMVAGVEKMRGYGFDEHEELIAWEGGWYVMRSDVTDYLHGLAPETDR
jgi:hypothetical protein